MPFIDPNELVQLEQSTRSRQAYQTYRALASSQTADSVSSWARTYPTMRPGELFPLAKAGAAPDGPIGKAASKASAKKKAKGIGWGTLKELAVGDPRKAFDQIGHSLTGSRNAPLKVASRGMAIGLSAPGEMVQGVFREAVTDGFQPGDILRGARQTTMSSAIGELRENGLGGADYGSGYFAGGEVKAEQVRRARAGGTLPGANGTTKAITIGRYTADKVFEPGTRRYGTLSGLIDMTVALAGDPTTFLGGSARRGIEASKTLVDNSGRVRQVVARPDAKVIARVRASRDEGLLDDAEAERLLENAGGLSGHPRKTVLPERVAEWIDGKDGRRLREYLATETNFERMRKLTKGKVDVETLVRLTDAKSDAEVLDVLAPKLGVDIREKFGVSRGALQAASGDNGFLARRVGGSRSRLASQMPGTHMDLTDADDAVETTARLLTTVNAPEEQIGKWTEAMARATDRNGRFSVYRKVLDDIRDTQLKAQGARLTGGQRTALTRIYDDYDETLRRYAIDEVGENAAIPGAIIDGNGKALPSPHLYNEYVNTAVPLPDARELRRATSQFVALVEKAGLRKEGFSVYDGTNALADFVTQSAFKPLVLARGAWTIRVVGEEQIRLASSGLTSTFAHPMSHIAMALGKKGGQDITGRAITESQEMQEALSRGSAGWGKDTSVVRSRHRVVIDRQQPGVKFDEALLDEIGKLSSDPVMQRVLNGLGPGDAHPDTSLTGLDAVKDWFFNGAGQKFRGEMANADKGGDRAFLLAKSDPTGAGQSADDYIESLLTRAKTTAGGDHRLLEAIATGTVNGKPLSFKNAGGGTQINRAALKDINALLDEGVGPQKLPADLMVHVKNGPGSELLAAYDKSVEVMFDYLMSKPTNFLSRSPAFQQFYWKRNAELLGRMTPETQAQAIRVAKDTGLPKHLVRQMERAKAAGSGELNVAEADMIAKAFALDSTRKLLYDLNDRSQFFDITRAIFPFGEAWKEVATTWARIGVTENPTTLRRAQQVVTGLRSADTDGDGEGFFYTDEQTGEEVFNYPFSGWINERITGVPFPLQATAKGLNIFSTSVIPGVGPVVQIPAGRLLPDTPQWDEVRKVVLPFGERNMDSGVLESFLPAWFQKARVALMDEPPVDQQRMFANTVMDIQRYLVSTGDYSYDSDEEQERLLEESKRRAKAIYGYRALAQFFVPSPPSPEALVKDKNGDLYYSIKLVEDMRKLQDEDYATATQRFIDKWGEGAFLTTISKTTGAGTPSQELYDFARESPQIARAHKDVYAYFLPSDGEFSMDAYAYQLRAGERAPIKPEDALKQVNQRLGSHLYRQAQTKVTQNEDGRPAPTAEERVWLAEVRDAIREEYPGYAATPGNLDEQERLISSMVRASRDPVLSRTDVGQGIKEYVAERQAAIELARERGFTSFGRAKGAADIREALRAVAEEIGEDNPDFLEVWDRTFSREMVDDVADEEG